MSLFSERLRWLREKSGMNQREMSEKIGMSQQGYSSIETGKREPNLTTLYHIRHVLNESLDFIIGYYLEDSKTEQLYELYAEARKAREIAEDDVEYWESRLNEEKDDLQKYLKLAKDARENARKLSAKEERAFNLLFDHISSIPGVDGEYATREYWYNRYHSYEEGNTKLEQNFWDEFDKL